ncbi:MAG TPA: alpha/beta hydrolase [Gemmatimonadales bacterium]|nr:alpha/beta hydrolase [Gemmatimonadales bacterium]
MRGPLGQLLTQLGSSRTHAVVASPARGRIAFRTCLNGSSYGMHRRDVCRLVSALALSASVASTAPAQSPWTLTPNLEYARIAGRSLRLDLYLPAASGPGPWPVVLWFHGQPGRRSPTPARQLVRCGYAVASVEYRSPRAARFPAQVLDGRAAVRWIRANAARLGLDADHIAAWGESAGGYLAVMLATSADVGTFDTAAGNAAQSDSGRIQAAVNYFGPGRRGAASPLRYVSAGDTPVLIVHGTADRTVSPGRSRQLHHALQAAGVESTLELVRGAGHDFRRVHTPRVDSLVRTFLDRYLRPHGRSS